MRLALGSQYVDFIYMYILKGLDLELLFMDQQKAIIRSHRLALSPTQQKAQIT